MLAIATLSQRWGVARTSQESVDVELPPEALERLDQATGFRHRFPTTFIQDTKPSVLAAADADVGRRLPRRL